MTNEEVRPYFAGYLLGGPAHGESYGVHQPWVDIQECPPLAQLCAGNLSDPVEMDFKTHTRHHYPYHEIGPYKGYFVWQGHCKGRYGEVPTEAIRMLVRKGVPIPINQRSRKKIWPGCPDYWGK